MNQIAVQERDEIVALSVAAEKRSVAKLPIVAGFFDLQSFELMQRVAKGFAASTLVPKIYQGNTAEAIGNCMIALNLAKRIGADPLMVMQNLVIVQNRPSWSSQFLIASVNTCGRFTALRFEFFGTRGLDDWGCRAWAIEKATGEKLIGADIAISLAKKEGWFSRNGSKWLTMPQQMLIYRSGAWWTRAYAPELSMGLMTADEVEDVIDLTPDAYREVAPSAEPKRAQTIEARLDQFAEADADHTDTDTTSAPGPAPSSAEGAETGMPPDLAPVSPPASSAVHEGAGGDAGPSLEPKLAAAMQIGRDARSSGYERTLPRKLNYKSMQAEQEAFFRGWDEENRERAVAENGGTV